ncbi:MAG: PadR family transcriptional regulator [Candidatus Binatia bacterium]
MASGNLQYAVLGLIASKTDGVHGYQLKGECEAIADEFWALNYGRLYRILDELESTGALSVADEIQKGRPNKKVYRITEKGKQNLDDWLLSTASTRSSSNNAASTSRAWLASHGAGAGSRRRASACAPPR